MCVARKGAGRASAKSSERERARKYMCVCARAFVRVYACVRARDVDHHVGRAEGKGRARLSQQIGTQNMRTA
eukprot:2687105-Pleurochrysis_carterae.AAC.6